VREKLTDTDERLVDTREVLARIPIHRSTLNDMIKTGRFPAPLRLLPSKLLWRWSTILAWLDERERNPVPPRVFRFQPKARPLPPAQIAARAKAAARRATAHKTRGGKSAS
jgi:predicted DNA-binding transcriptional regulator AlpA